MAWAKPARTEQSEAQPEKHRTKAEQSRAAEHRPEEWRAESSSRAVQSNGEQRREEPRRAEQRRAENEQSRAEQSMGVETRAEPGRAQQFTLVHRTAEEHRRAAQSDAEQSSTGQSRAFRSSLHSGSQSWAHKGIPLDRLRRHGRNCGLHPCVVWGCLPQAGAHPIPKIRRHIGGLPCQTFPDAPTDPRSNK
jgi:hypothetical protein